MDPKLKNTLNTLIARMDQMDQCLLEFREQANVNCRDLATRLERIETNRRKIIEDDESRNDCRSPSVSEFNFTIQLTDAQYIKSVKVDAPFFDGRLDPQVYIDWQLAMDRYFHWHDMSESKKIRFVMMKVMEQAGQFWENLERIMRYRKDDSVET